MFKMFRKPSLSQPQKDLKAATTHTERAEALMRFADAVQAREEHNIQDEAALLRALAWTLDQKSIGLAWSPAILLDQKRLTFTIRQALARYELHAHTLDRSVSGRELARLYVSVENEYGPESAEGTVGILMWALGFNERIDDLLG